jgi:hypothetical protein
VSTYDTIAVHRAKQAGHQNVTKLHHLEDHKDIHLPAEYRKFTVSAAQLHLAILCLQLIVARLLFTCMLCNVLWPCRSCQVNGFPVSQRFTPVLPNERSDYCLIMTIAEQAGAQPSKH